MEQVMIVMVPFAAQGHLNQLLHFAINLSSSSTGDLAVHYACSASYIRQAKSRIQGRDSASLEKVHFHELPLSPFPWTPLPGPGANFPSHLLLSLDAAMRLRSPLAALFHSLSVGCRRLIVVYDPMMSFVSPDVASLPNAESYLFQCVPSYNELHRFCQLPSYDASKMRREVLDVILDPFEGCLSPGFLEFVTRNYRDHIDAEAGTLFNACRPIEGEFLDLLSGLPRYRGKKVFAVGPLNPLAIERNSTHDKHRCLEWLDEQPPASVLYVSFGSTSTMSDEQIEQLAVGLERSGQRFIWVLRDADLGDIYADAGGRNGRREVPAGFEERVQGRGMVVRGWAPQLPILAHPSTGGFMSHCGWNSCMESLSMGVPIAAWPMHSDQPRNAVLVTEYLKVGVAVREWARRKELVSLEAIEKAIKEVMVPCCEEEGNETRKRARLLGEAIRLSVAEGGSSRADLDSFVQHITRDA